MFYSDFLQKNSINKNIENHIKDAGSQFESFSFDWKQTFSLILIQMRRISIAYLLSFNSRIALIDSFHPLCRQSIAISVVIDHISIVICY